MDFRTIIGKKAAESLEKSAVAAKAAADVAGTLAEFVPEAVKSPGTSCGIVVKTGVRDLTGTECGMLFRAESSAETKFYGMGGKEIKALNFKTVEKAIRWATSPERVSQADAETMVGVFSLLFGLAEGRLEEINEEKRKKFKFNKKKEF